MPVLIKDIAKKAGVSVATVSRVVNENGYVNRDTRAKVVQAMDELNYRPNLVARSLATKQSNTIGLMIPHINSPFFSAFASGVEERADELGYSVMLCHTREDNLREEKCLNLLLNRQVDGVISTPVCKEKHFYQDCARIVPVVFAARKIEGIGISAVVVDNAAGSYRILERLIKQGHRQIAVVNGPQYVSTGRERWFGVRQALEDNSLALDSCLIREGDFTTETGSRITHDIFDGGQAPTAIFAANHMTAVGVLRALAERGCRVPDDIVVASFEGFTDTEFGQHLMPKVVCNQHPTREMAICAVDLLIEQIQHAKAGRPIICKDIILNTTLMSEWEGKED